MQQTVKLLEDAIRLHQAGRLADAEALYQQVLLLAPDNADALHLLGLIKRRYGSAALAVELISKAATLRPEQSVYHSNLGLSYLDLADVRRAEACFRRALELKPNFAQAMVNLGNVLRAQAKFDEAIALYRKALQTRPGFAEAYNNLGNALRDIDQTEEAAACYRNALALRPDYAEANNNLGVLFKSQDRHDEALACFRQAIESDAGNVDALCNLASTLAEQGRPEEALAHYRRALEIRPQDPIARWALAMAQIPSVYADQQQVEAARLAFSNELADLDAWFTADRLDRAEPAVGSSQPYHLAYLEQDNRALLSRYGKLCGRIMAHWQHEHRLAPSSRNNDGKIRLGILSSHIHEHSVWRALTRGWLEQIDRARFELHLFYLDSKADDQTALALSLADSSTVGIRTLAAWVDAICASQVDALIYPEIGMDPMTVKLASLRLAPVQIVAWGHPETTGLPTIDYFLSAELFEPPSAQRFYAEKLVELPNLGCHYQPLALSAEPPNLQQLGLAGVKLLLCPGTPYKYLPEHDRVWVEIAKRLESCKLVFFHHRKRALSQMLERRLHAAFQAAGVPYEQRVAFVPWLPRAAYYGLMQHAYLCLDSIGFSGYNTAMQAIECALPVVALDGRFMRGRLASGIVRRLGLNELIAPSVEDFITLIQRIARDSDYQRDLSSRIVAARGILFQDQAPIRAMEEFLIRVAKSPADRG